MVNADDSCSICRQIGGFKLLWIVHIHDNEQSVGAQPILRLCRIDEGVLPDRGNAMRLLEALLQIRILQIADDVEVHSANGTQMGNTDAGAESVKIRIFMTHNQHIVRSTDHIHKLGCHNSCPDLGLFLDRFGLAPVSIHALFGFDHRLIPASLQSDFHGADRCGRPLLQISRHIADAYRNRNRNVVFAYADFPDTVQNIKFFLHHFCQRRSVKNKQIFIPIVFLDHALVFFCPLLHDLIDH